MRRKHTDAKLQRLSRIPALHALNQQQLRLISALGDEAALPEDTVLARQGRLPTQVFLVTGGRITIDPGGARACAQSGFIGASAARTYTPHTESVVTAGPVTALVFDLRSFGRLVNELPDLLQSAEAPAQEALANAPVPAWA